MKVALCTLFRLNNRYLEDWIKYYRQLGVDLFYLYDNAFDDEEKATDLEYIRELMDDGIVKYVPIYNDTRIQVRVFNAAYSYIKEENPDLDWVGFFDCDEYLEFTDDTKTVQDFLSKALYKNTDAVIVPWECYTSSKTRFIVADSPLPMYKRFDKPIQLSENDYENWRKWHLGPFGKSFVRVKDASKKITFRTHVHQPLGQNVLEDGTAWNHRLYIPNPSYKYAKLKHYRYRSFPEHYNRCYQMLSNENFSGYRRTMDIFARYHNLSDFQKKILQSNLKLLNIRYGINITMLPNQKNLEEIKES